MSRWQLFLFNKRHLQVAFALLIMIGLTVHTAIEPTIFYGGFHDLAYWAAMAFFGLLIALIIAGNEWHYRELKNGRSS